MFDPPATGSLPPGLPWPGQEDYGSGFSGGTLPLPHADSVLPRDIKKTVTNPTQSSVKVKWREGVQ